jgi:hypothetical protein
VGYVSPNQGQDGSKIGDLSPDPELARLRGEDKKDEEVHRIISWTTRKSYPLWAGTSLSARYQVGDECHEMQLWEETPDDMIIGENHAEEVYKWLMERIRG